MSGTRSRTRVATALALALAMISSLLIVASTPLAAQAAPRITVTRVVSGLSIPWDVTWVGDMMLYDERAGAVWSKRGNAAPKKVRLDLPRIYAQGESGLLGMVADPAASRNKYFYTCMAINYKSGNPRGVEIWKWKLTADDRAIRIRRLIKGIPLTSGRHTGCRLRFRSAKALYVGTGDAAVGTNPQNLQSLGGKILRVRSTGGAPKSNPFYRLGGNARFVWNYGHRNVQGLIKRPGISELWSVEHGPARDDEVNRVWKGKNYGWDPVPGYNESVPMTDRRRHPDAHGSKWSSGTPTVAPGGGTFISGSQWGSWNGNLAVAMLKGQGVKIFYINSATRIYREQTVLRGYGRIRTIQQGPDGALYVLTGKSLREVGRVQLTRW